MKNLRGLFFNLIGVIKDATAFPQETKRVMRENQSIQVVEDRNSKGRWFARVLFLPKEDGSFIPPTTALSERDIDYFLVQVVNTYKGSTIIVKTGKREKPKNIWVDAEGVQRCDIGGGAATIMRVSQGGNVEVYRVTAPTADNRKQVKVFTRYEDNLPFENERLLDAVVADDPILQEFADDLKGAYARIKERKFENKMNLDEVKFQHIQNQKKEERKIKRAEVQTETPPPPPTIPESGEEEKKKTRKKITKKGDEADVKAAKDAKAAKEKAQEEAAEEEMKDLLPEETVELEQKGEKDKDTESKLHKEPLTQKLNIPVKVKRETKK